MREISEEKFLRDCGYERSPLDGQESSLFTRPLDADKEYPRFHLEVFFNKPRRLIFHLDQRPHHSSFLDDNPEIPQEIKRLKEFLKMNCKNPEEIRKISGALDFFLLFGDDKGERPTIDNLVKTYKKYPLKGINKRKYLESKYKRETL